MCGASVEVERRHCRMSRVVIELVELAELDRSLVDAILHFAILNTLPRPSLPSFLVSCFSN